MTRRVLLVCTGNTCRSPLAEVMLRRLVDERALDVVVSSAGTSASNGMPASDGSVLVGIERGLDLSLHRARLLTRELVDDADLVLAMATHHVELVGNLGGERKVFLLTNYARGQETGRSIPDPFGGRVDEYRRMADELELELSHAVNRLAAEPPARGSA